MAARGFLFGDSYDYYVTADLTKKWTAFTSPSIASDFSVTPTAMRNGINGLLWEVTHPTGYNENSSLFVTLAPGDPTTIIARTAFRYTAAQGVNVPALLTFRDNLSIQGFLGLRFDGKLQYFLGGSMASGTALVSTVALQANTFYHIKLKVKFATGTSGTAQLWIDAVDQGTVSGINTAPSGVAQWDVFEVGCPALSGGNIFNPKANGQFHYDDLNVHDVDDGRFDLIAIALHAQTGNGANTGYTPSTGANHGDMVKDALQDGDSTTNDAAAVGLIDTYPMEDLPTPATIAFIQTVETGRKADAGDRLCANVLRIGGTNYVGMDYPPNQTYSQLLTPYNVSPATGVAFTDTEINAMESGQKVTA